ncbi:unnamed protein product [Phytomonas sp. EM1]|nr:unnamed protein product [Phytomonas sp. EM1]|eukprot:CCW61193.1 unnamed protein product [Phytomonas sp. isolate EM1]
MSSLNRKDLEHCLPTEDKNESSSGHMAEATEPIDTSQTLVLNEESNPRDQSKENLEAEGVSEEISDCDDEGDILNDFHFGCDEEAVEARQEGLKAYNECRYSDALDQQYRVVRYFSQKYGATAPQCGVYFLDYALSQLRLLQSQSTMEDALKPRDEEAMEACFINLEVARVAFQKKERENDNDDVATELFLAEVHNALAQLNIEKEDYDAALREYEAELLIYRSLQIQNLDAVPAGRVVSALYGIADCFAKEGDFAGAEERFQITLNEIAKYPTGTISVELIDDIKDMLDDARDMKDGRFNKIQEQIQQQFAADAEQMPTAHEFYEVGNYEKHPFLSSVPGGAAELNAESLSMPISATGQVLGMNDHSNSQSISLFPAQSSRSGPSLATTGPVRHVTVRKKPKNVTPAASAPIPTEGPIEGFEAKRLRTES